MILHLLYDSTISAFFSLCLALFLSFLSLHFSGVLYWNTSKIQQRHFVPGSLGAWAGSLPIWCHPFHKNRELCMARTMTALGWEISYSVVCKCSRSHLFFYHDLFLHTFIFSLDRNYTARHICLNSFPGYCIDIVSRIFYHSYNSL